jgi:metallopeptidase MepB
LRPAAKRKTKFVENVTPEAATFENVILPLACAENAKSLEQRQIRFYESSSTDITVRNASSLAKNLFDEFVVETAMREDLFSLVEAVIQGTSSLTRTLDIS